MRAPAPAGACRGRRPAAARPARRRGHAVAVLFAAASIFFGIFPSPLFDLVAHAGRALGLF